MNDQQHAFWLAYIRQLADLMRLRDWDIELSRGEPDSATADAEIRTWYGQRGADVRLPERFFGQPPEQQRYFITHELMHCHVDNYSECTRLYVNNNGDREAYIAQVYQREEEMLVDTLARVIASFLPLPGVYEETFEHLRFSMPVDPLLSSRIPHVVPTETFNGADR